MIEALHKFLITICEQVGCRQIGIELMAMDEEAIFNADYEAVMERILAAMGRRKKYQMEFHDRTMQVLDKKMIIQYHKEYTLEGEPMMVINDFPTGIKMDGNPVVDMRLVYDDEDLCDADLNELHLIKN